MYIQLAFFVLGQASEGPREDSLIGPILNLGAVGACLILLGWYYTKKDAKYEQRIDQMLQREKDFQIQEAEAAEKYRVAMEKFSKMMEVVIALLKGRGP